MESVLGTYLQARVLPPLEGLDQCWRDPPTNTICRAAAGFESWQRSSSMIRFSMSWSRRSSSSFSSLLVSYPHLIVTVQWVCLGPTPLALLNTCFSLLSSWPLLFFLLTSGLEYCLKIPFLFFLSKLASRWAPVKFLAYLRCCDHSHFLSRFSLAAAKQ